MERGIVRKYIAERGFGFIVPAERHDSPDVFFHIKSVVGDYVPAEGDPVEFNITYDAQGRAQATKVVPALRAAAD